MTDALAVRHIIRRAIEFGEHDDKSITAENVMLALAKCGFEIIRVQPLKQRSEHQRETEAAA